MSDCVDVAVVGAGAAGIAAARRLVERHRAVLLIEALPRLGGRAHTATFDGLTLDLGCGWLHSAKRNPLATLAQVQGQLLDRSPSAWHRQLRNLHFPPAAQREAWHAFQDLSERLHRQPPPSDRAGDALARDDRWRPFLDGVSSFINGAELDQLSVRDYLAYEDASTDDNWRLPAGYGAFIAAQGAALPMALDTQVRSVTLDADIILDTNRGPIHARAVIVAVSTAVLARGAIHFTPALDDHLQAASRLPLGLADKVYLSLADREAVPAESHLLGRIDSAATGSYYIRPFGLPVIECFLGGACARGLEKLGPDAAFGFVIDELKSLLEHNSPAASRRSPPLAGKANRPSAARTATPCPGMPMRGAYWQCRSVSGCALPERPVPRPIFQRLTALGKAGLRRRTASSASSPADRA